MSDDIKKGLLGIVVDETEVSKVMPEINSPTYRGYAAQDSLRRVCCITGQTGKCMNNVPSWLLLPATVSVRRACCSIPNQKPSLVGWPIVTAWSART